VVRRRVVFGWDRLVLGREVATVFILDLPAVWTMTVIYALELRTTALVAVPPHLVGAGAGSGSHGGYTRRAGFLLFGVVDALLTELWISPVTQIPRLSGSLSHPITMSVFVSGGSVSPLNPPANQANTTGPETALGVFVRRKLVDRFVDSAVKTVFHG